MHIEHRIICLRFDLKIDLRLLFVRYAVHVCYFRLILNNCINKLIHEQIDDACRITMDSYSRYYFDIIRIKFLDTFRVIRIEYKN